MSLFIASTFKDKAYAGIWGFIVGDALGVPHEFKSRFELRESAVTGMEGWGTHNQPPGTWSDDTSMMLCVLENNVQVGGTNGLSKLFLKWYQEGYHTPHGEVFDIGVTTRDAMERLKAGVPPLQAGSSDEGSAGNGSLMRSLPYAFAEEFAKGFAEMVVQHGITHAVGLCHESSIFYIRLVRALAEGSSKERALAVAGGYLRMGWRITDDIENVDSREIFTRLFDPSFPALPEESIASGGYVIESLEAAVWCFMNGTDYRSCVLKAVNLGGDTDTVAALTGGLCGIYYGIGDIPQEWMESIVQRENLDKMIQDWLEI
jgi:ADP-ribosylglycohydrolase